MSPLRLYLIERKKKENYNAKNTKGQQRNRRLTYFGGVVILFPNLTSADHPPKTETNSTHPLTSARYLSLHVILPP